MENNFEQISKVSGFMKHNGGLLFRDLSETEFEFKSTIHRRCRLKCMSGRVSLSNHRAPAFTC